MNPIFSVWFKPKSTAKYVIENKSKNYSIILLILASYATTLNGLQESGFTEDRSLILVTFLILISGPIFGLIGFFVGSWLYTLVGKWMNGSGTLHDMRKAIGLTAIPNLFMLPIIMVFILIYGDQFFQRPAWGEYSSLPLGASLLLSLITLIITTWNIVITSKTIGVVHNFSSWKGLGVSLVIGISIAILLIPVIFIIIGLSFI
ncbi:YIP1 family protein [Jeotgalibacillus haloalkalitolerans]|uniref:YIP1 family protein n=1 Tax=Jeotgalibacillus haloalkalitolerans TaxID=3104292 RepID=A0ABU5KID8_9BACL|nr:YIP1 family protein [Jeotgalibacillus sp. HH7-29]MDZ5710893.1 YIP1 family protein [Jeotgalibacillus sp. HH7-29]